MKQKFITASLLLALSATGITYSAIVQKSTPVTPRSPITSNTTNNIVQDITALNAAIDAITGGSDAKIGTLTSGKWCTSDGSKIQCTADAPSGGTISEATVDGYCSNNGYLTAETDPKVGTITESKYCLGVSGKVDCTANAPTVTETDPKVGTLTNAKWCTSDGSKVNCAENAPIAGSSAWGDLTGVPAGFSDGTDADTIYTHPTTAGNKHVPAGGDTDNVLKYSADGTAVWGAEIDPKIGTITNTKYCFGIGGKVECTANAPITKFTDGTDTNDAVYMTGKVGIGTATPFSKLTIDTGNITLTDDYKLQWGGINNFIGGSTASNFVAIGTNGSEKMRVIADGKVGIGTSTPKTALDVNGLVRVGQIATTSLPACDVNTLGAIVFDITDDTLKFCKSSGWVKIGITVLPASLSITPTSSANMNVTGPDTEGTPVVFTVSNTGETTTATLTTTLSNTTNFTITANTCVSQTLAGGANCTVTVKPIASLNATYSGTLTVSGGGLNVVANLSGTASGLLTGTETGYENTASQSGRYITASGTTTDQVTGLVWQQDGSTAGTKTWTDAITYCDGLSLGGQTDWRLPDVRELMSIVDNEKYNPSIDVTAFTNTVNSYYWTSTTYPSGTAYAFVVYFDYGYSSYGSKASTHYIRCVR